MEAPVCSAPGGRIEGCRDPTVEARTDAGAEERDILKKSPRISPGMQSEIRVRCRASRAVLGTRDVPVPSHSSERLLCLAEEPVEQTGEGRCAPTELIRKAWEESGKVYGYRKLHDDLLDQGETCCLNRVARLASLAGVKARIGYKRRPGSYGGSRPGWSTTRWHGSSMSMHPIGLGDGHHLHQDAGGLRLSGGRDPPLLPPRDWLVDAEPSDNRSGSASIADGGVAQEADEHGATRIRERSSRAWTGRHS